MNPSENKHRKWVLLRYARELKNTILQENIKALLVQLAKQRKRRYEIAAYKYIRGNKHKKETELF